MLVLSCGTWQLGTSGLVMLLSCHVTQVLTFLSQLFGHTRSFRAEWLELPFPNPSWWRAQKCTWWTFLLSHLAQEPVLSQAVFITTSKNYIKLFGLWLCFLNLIESEEKWLWTEDIVSDSQFIKQISKMGISIICGGADNRSTLDMSPIWTSIKFSSVQKKKVSSAKSFTFLAPLRRNNRKGATSCRYRKPARSWQKDFIGLKPKSLDVNTLLI